MFCMSSFCQSLTEKHIRPRSQIEGIELSKDMICTKTVCTPAQCKNYLPAIQENFGFAGVQEICIVFTKSASQKQGYPAVEGQKREKESLRAHARAGIPASSKPRPILRALASLASSDTVVHSAFPTVLVALSTAVYVFLSPHVP